MLFQEEITKFEQGLYDFDPKIRKNAILELEELVKSGEIQPKTANKDLNLHCHTFYSYNGYGYSPSYLAWLGKKDGMFALGIVDFDVLDGVDEFLAACERLGIRGVCGLETRVFIPELAEHEINSPGEPGISYHMGIGFTSCEVPETAKDFLKLMRDQAAARTRGIVERVNPFLAPVELDYATDVVPLTPAGNATERHVCQAYYEKAVKVIPDAAKRAEFWAEKLETPIEKITAILDDPVELQGLIRKKTMKSGGVGYVKPDPAAFPLLKDMNKFVLECGAIPVITWLNGESGGEAAPDKLVELHIAQGAAALNIIPDRNWNFSDPEERKRKVHELNRIIAAAKARDLPIIVGTEMNAPGQKHVDDFGCDALAPYHQDFIDGAAIISAHTILQPQGKGYLSKWAAEKFDTVAEKNKWFAAYQDSILD